MRSPLSCSTLATAGLLLFLRPCLAAQPERALQHRIERLDISTNSMATAMRELVVAGNKKFVVGFEQITDRGAGSVPGPRIALSVERRQVSDILREICAQDPRYTFQEHTDGVIDVFPAHEAPVIAAIFAMRISSVSIDVADWPANLFGRVREFAPELREYLDRQAREYATQHRLPVAGSPGVTLRTDVPPPTIQISMQDVTVRELLDRIAFETLAHPARDTLGRIVSGPSGWMFTFKIDENARTGLGGYLTWRPFLAYPASDDIKRDR